MAATPVDFPNLLPMLLAMPRSEKLRVIEALAGDLAKEAEQTPFGARAESAWWSPHDSYAAASQLVSMLNSTASNEPAA